MSSSQTSNSSILAVASDVLAIETEALQRGQSSLNEAFADAVRLIMERVPPGKVVVLGVGKSGHIGNKLAATLSSTGTPAFFVHPTEAGHGDLGVITRGDVAIVISYSGNSSEISAVLPYFRRNSIPIIGMTGGIASPIAKASDLVILTSVEREACPLGLAPTSSTTLTLALGDALAMCLLKCRGFTPEHFGETHPHGKLGRRLLVLVKDLMVAGKDLPVVREGTTLRACLHEMTRGTLGIVAVVADSGALVGVFTDGDLRRVLELNRDVLAEPIESFMSRKPKTINAERLAVDAVESMEKFKVNSLLVLDDEMKLVGAINMRQLLQAGVI